MKEWLIRLIVSYLIQHLTPENIKEWADQLKQKVYPWILNLAREWKDEVILKLREAAQDTENQIDDAIVDAFERFLDELLPVAPVVA